MSYNKYKNCTAQELLKNPKNIDWINVTRKYNFSTQDLKKLKDYLQWDELSYRRKFRQEELRLFADKINWSWVNYNNILNSNTTIRQFRDYIDFHYLKYLYFNKDIRREFGDKIEVYNYSHLNEDELNEFIPKQEWDHISQNIWNEGMIKHCKKFVNWNIISQRRRYTMQFYWDMRNYLNWHSVTKLFAPKWKLYAFKRFQKYLDWDEIKTWRWINLEVKKTFWKRLGLKKDEVDFAS